MTLPVIFGWMLQKYAKVPAFENVKENLSSVSRTLDLKTPSLLTTVCGISSRLTHVTVVPTAMVTACGPNTKLSILTSVAEPWACGGGAFPAFVERVAPKIESTAKATAAIET